MDKIKILRRTMLITFLVVELVIILFAIIFMREEGSIEGTGFVYREIAGAGSNEYDVDDQGNIYFAINTSGILTGGGITVYDSQGKYKYTLNYNSSGGGKIYVNIDGDNNINIYDLRADKIITFNSLGEYLSTQMIERSNVSDEYHMDNSSVRKRNGILYKNCRGVITAEKDGKVSVVFTIPFWQRCFAVLDVVAMISFVSLLLSWIIPKIYQTFKERYG